MLFLQKCVILYIENERGEFMLELGLLVVIIVWNLVIGATGIIYYGTLILGGIFLIYWMVVWFSKIVKNIGKVCHWVKELLEL